MGYLFRFLNDNIKRVFNMPSSPFLLNYSITLRCNLGCRYCGVSRLKDNYAKDELSPEDIALFLRDRKLQKLDVIAVSGGEPFLKKDLADILLVFQKMAAPKIFHITTNGYLGEEIVESICFLKTKGLNLHLKVSIDDIGERHDALRGKDGSFRHALLTVQRLKRKFSQKELFIGINQTIFEENYSSIDEVKRLALGLGCAYRGFIGLKKRPLYSGVMEENYGLVDLGPEAAEYIKDSLKENSSLRFRRQDGGFGFIEELVLRHYLKGQIRMLEQKGGNKHRCMNLFTHFRLNPNGDIIACSYDLEVLGNIRQENYSSIVNKRHTYDKMRKIKSCGRCWLGCEVSPNFVSSLFAF